MSTQPNNNKNNDWVWLPGMIVCFAVGLWPIALVILFWKIFGSDKKKAAARTRHPYDLQKEAKTVDDLSRAADDLSKAATDFVNSVTGKSSAGKTAKAKPAAGTFKGIKARGGTGLIIGGAIVSAIFGMGFFVEFVNALSWGGLEYMISELVVLLAFLVAGLVLLCAGIGKNRRRDRWVSYLGYIGANRQVDLAHMAAAFDVPVRTLCNDLRKMLSEKVLPAGYLDLAAGKLILSEMGYQAPPKTEPKEQPKEQPKAEQPQDDNAILQEIRAVNDAIPDPVMSAKIDRIGEITGKILDYQRRNPGKGSQLRSFLNYYLPTTLKILRSYAQLDAQGVEGENITAAKKRIEGMMDKVVEGFETQLDKLFADSAMDISSDVAVLEQMLEKDGLSGNNQGMGMTL